MYLIEFETPQDEYELLKDASDYKLIVADLSPSKLLVFPSCYRFAVLRIASSRKGEAYLVSWLGKSPFTSLDDSF
jgi:hypothetical protein